MATKPADPAATEPPEQEVEPVEPVDSEAEAPTDVEPADDDGPKVEDEPAPDDDNPVWARIEESLGELPEAANETVLAEIDGATIGMMPPAARALIKQLAAEKRTIRAKSAEKIQAVRDEVTAAREELARERAEFVQQKAAFAKWAQSPAIKKFLAKADDAAELDPFTREGAAALAERGGAKALKEALGPAVEESAKIEKQAAWERFVSANPQLRNKQFYDEFNGALTSVQGRSWDDAVNAVIATRAKRETAERRQAEQRARADSARRTQRASGGGSGKPAPEGILDRLAVIEREGWNGHTGDMAVARYLKANPKEAQALQSL